jgi:hypothetical protein
MSFVLWPLGYLVVGALLGGLVAPATRSDGRERREILAMFITAWPLICAITVAIHGSPAAEPVPPLVVGGLEVARLDALAVR